LFGLGAPGTNDSPYLFPDGMGVKIEQGQQLLLNLHLLNATEGDLSGTSGFEVLRVDPKDVQTEADIVLMGTEQFSVPPGVNSQDAECTMPRDTTIITFIPHMHLLGQHMRVAAEFADTTEQTMFDGDFNFDLQSPLQMSPLSLRMGEKVRLRCTWNNTTSQVVHFGYGSHDEMCFAVAYKYPAGGSAFCLF
jgi:hypothetical protein